MYNHKKLLKHIFQISKDIDSKRLKRGTFLSGHIRRYDKYKNLWLIFPDDYLKEKWDFIILL